MPDTLVPRAENRTLFLSGLFAVSLVLIAIARISNYKAIGTVIQAFFSGGPATQLLKDNMRIGSLSSILLVVNYMIASFICVFLLLNRTLGLSPNISLIFASIIPLALTIFELLGLAMTSFITGEGKTMEPAFQTAWIGYEFIGLPLSILALVWIMNPALNVLCVVLFSILLGTRVLQRITKSSILVLNRGVAWYYIFLYLCTLEILPLIVAYYCLQLNFRALI
ncbi:MAG: hypothetical protein RL632_831 [Bacteroidota bacterium]